MVITSTKTERSDAVQNDTVVLQPPTTAPLIFALL